MATTQRPRTSRRPSQSGPDPASRGLLLIVVAVALGAILILKGGVVGFDSDKSGVDIGAGSGTVPESSAAPTTAAAPSTIAPAQVKVVSANGTTTNGLAGKASAFLATQGYTSVTTTEAATPATATTVFWAAGFEENAKAIAASLGLPPTQAQQLPAGKQLAKNQPADSGVVMVLGPDVQAKVTGTPAASTTAPGAKATTTAPGAKATSTTAKP